MKTRKIGKDAFKGFVSGLIKQQKVFGPCAKGDRFEFEQLDSAEQLRLDYDVTLRPPGRKYLLPPVETLLTYEMGDGYKSVYDETPFILLGVHPYDMEAINQSDRLFSQDNYDCHYMKRRQNATIIACDVVTPSQNVFAASMGTATVKTGFDILLTDIGDSYVMEIGTKKGEKLVAGIKDPKDADDNDLEKRKKVWAENQERLNKHKLNCDYSYLPKLLERAYKHQVWEEKAKTCFSCGSCNQVCPTCYCFNVQDDVSWNFMNGKRERVWDGCLLDGFTKVAGDHEFRKKRQDRFRHRLYRKAKYVPEKIGSSIPACVGCGRCVSACLPDIANPIKVYNRLIEDLGIK
ncbi:MAG: 4Fe-4S dicluster domain-containing protein [Sedimentisphaerales bacterium]|nr:4Fe-4S dicluster domain-containing protein [Sedimentisphaerales bacterium]